MALDTQDYLLNKVFSIPYLDGMVYNHDVDFFVQNCNSLINPESVTYGDGIQDVYQYMGKHYRNEYYFKNTIFNQLLIKNHNIRTTAAFSEFPLGNAKADFVTINGKGSVYEIKTDLDNFNRLQGQIVEYYKVFPYVNVVVGYRHYLKAREILGDLPVGIYVLYRTDNLVCRKKLFTLTNICLMMRCFGY